MKVMIVPMAAMAETSGTFSRTTILATDLLKSGIDVALCAAKDMNYKPVTGVNNYDLPVPMPLGLPPALARHLFPVAQKLGLTSHKTVSSFDEVLHLTGNTYYDYLKQSIASIRKAIQHYEPDVIYSEFNSAAIIAAKLENKKLFASASIPTEYEYANTPKLAKDTNKLLTQLHLPTVNSNLQLFSWADMRFVPSCYELEPFQASNVRFCGSWKKIQPIVNGKKDKILVYMGNGTISKKHMVKEILSAWKGSAYQVYIAGLGLSTQTIENIEIAPYFDFKTLLPEALLSIHHGGQNSMIDALIYGVPQIICAGKVFERNYNAKSIELNKAGIALSYKNFSAEALLSAFHNILSNPDYQENAKKLGTTLLSLGGTEPIIQACKELKAY